MSNPINNALDLAPIETNSKVVLLNEEVNQVSDDFDSVRSNLYDAVEISQVALQDMVGIAQQSQHPKAYEVLNSMIKTFADINMNIADLQVKKQRLAGPSKEEATHVTNNLFVGTTAELNKMLEDARNKTN